MHTTVGNWAIGEIGWEQSKLDLDPFNPKNNSSAAPFIHVGRTERDSGMTLARRFLMFVLIAGTLTGNIVAREFSEPKKLSKKQQAAVDAAPLGSEKNPIRCADPRGERAYLDRLRCPSNSAASYKRAGSVGEGPYGTILDLYEVTCAEWPEPVNVYMDMYHEKFTETRPVPRFAIVAPK